MKTGTIGSGCLAIACILSTVLAPAHARAADLPVGIVDEPCPAPIPMPGSVSDQLSAMLIVPRAQLQGPVPQPGDNPEFGAYFAALNDNTIPDWPRLCRFREANRDLLARGVRPRLVFMGDSITENWLLGDPGLFDDTSVNRGIGGQTTPQMLLRFRNDVIALKPRLVHILAGTNDVAGNTGPVTVQDVKNNLMSMTELALAHGIEVILGSIPPAATFYWQPELDPAPPIRELNTWMRTYAGDMNVGYIDYFTALAGPDRELRAELSNDGVHPNRDGYVIMRQLLERQLAAMGY